MQIEDITHEAAADFARGETSGTQLVRRDGRTLLIGRSGGAFTSGPLSLPFTATHLGLHWNVSGQADGLQVWARVSADGLKWSPWEALATEAIAQRGADSEVFAALLAAPEARFAQYRIHFPADPAVAISRVAVTAINAAGRSGGVTPLPTVTLEAPGKSATDKITLKVITREAWGCNESQLTTPRDVLWPEMYVPAKKVLLHHTATGDSYSDGAAEVRAVWAYHAITLGWGDIGYNALVDKYGNVYEGRHGRGEGSGRELLSADVVAGHCSSHNYGSTGVSAIGNYDRTKPSAALLTGIDAMAAFECARHYLDPGKASDFLRSDDLWHPGLNNVSGHYESFNTSCPGKYLTAYLPKLRGHVATRLAFRGAPTFTQAPAGRNLAVGVPVSFSWNGMASYYCFEGWQRQADSENITYLAGYAAWPGDDPLAQRQVWLPVDTQPISVTPSQPGHYTLHVRDGAGAYEANLTYLAT